MAKFDLGAALFLAALMVGCDRSLSHSPSSHEQSQLILTSERRMSAQPLGVLTGSLIDSVGTITVWGAEKSYIIRDTVREVRRGRGDSGARTIAIRQVPSGVEQWQIVGESLRLAIGDSAVRSITRIGRVHTITAGLTRNLLLIADSLGGLGLHVMSWNLDQPSIRIERIASRRTLERFRPLIAGDRSPGFVVVGSADSLSVVCLAEDGRETKRSMFDLERATDHQQNYVPAWKVASFVSLDQGFLVGLADTRSNARRILRFDDRCERRTDSLMKDGFLPSSSSRDSKLIVGTTQRDGGELVVMRWRWSTGEVVHPQTGEKP